VSDLLPALVPVCLLALASALAVILARRPVYAAIALLLHSLCLAMLFGILAAGFIAVSQVIIYSGAIVVLFLIVVTLLPSGGAVLSPGPARIAAALAAAAALLAALGAVMASGIPLASSVPPGGVDDVGRALFGPLLVAFELTAPLLLVAIVGAVAVWRRHEPQRTPPETSQRSRFALRRLVMHR
jgi:NADH-quinone oxidoreductase subunit J